MVGFCGIPYFDLLTPPVAWVDSLERLAGAGRRNQDGLVNDDPVGAPKAESVVNTSVSQSASGILFMVGGTVLRRTHSA